MDRFKSPTSVGVAQTFVVMGALYGAFMTFGMLIVRVPPEDWKPAGWTPPARPLGLVTTASVSADQALKTPQFWLLWGVLCLNVTAGIGVLAQASPMIQEMFQGRVTASAASGFVGFISLFNLLGRFFWASISDRLGRKATYMAFFVLGPILYCLVPTLGRAGSLPLFVLAMSVIFTMYGGGFATIPAYLRDVFGVYQVGAIHGRLLTAWSAAAILGPTLVTYLRQYQIDHGAAKADAYTTTMYIMAGLLVGGFACNLLVKPVDPKHHAPAP